MIKGHKAIPVSLVVLMGGGCAMGEMLNRTPQQVWDQGNTALFESALNSVDLANCIFNNSDDSWGGTQQAGVVKLDSGDYQVIRGNEKQRVISAVVRVSQTETGSRADFRFNGYNVGLQTHVKDMTAGCN